MSIELSGEWRVEPLDLGIVGWIVFGLIVGAVAKLLMPGRDPGGFVVTILLGIVGAIVGGFLGQADRTPVSPGLGRCFGHC